MEFLDDYEDGRPKFLFQSRQSTIISTIDSPLNSSKNNLLIIFTSLSFSLFFLTLSFFFFQSSQFLQPFFLWLSLSFLLGPFAPISLTCGDIRVGQGRIVEFPPEIDPLDVDESKKKVINKRNKGKRSDLEGSNANGSFDFLKNSGKTTSLEGFKGEINHGFLKSGENINGFVEKEWSDEDLGLLRKQIVKNPVGKPKRWEVISEVFKGRYSVESVINKAKSFGNEKPMDSDSYSKFLKDRKPVDKSLECVDGVGDEVVSWSSSEDIALLNALKAFPKEVSMRWEKIAASIPGKSKAVCMKRVSHLKKEFRSSKGPGEK